MYCSEDNFMPGCVLARFVGCVVLCVCVLCVVDCVLCVVGCVLVRFVGPSNVNQSKLLRTSMALSF